MSYMRTINIPSTESLRGGVDILNRFSPILEPSGKNQKKRGYGKSRSPFLSKKIGRGERIRTSDPRVPNAVLYQAEPRPDCLFGLRLNGER